jgi:hypothetical protein
LIVGYECLRLAYGRQSPLRNTFTWIQIKLFYKPQNNILHKALHSILKYQLEGILSTAVYVPQKYLWFLTALAEGWRRVAYAQLR